MVDCICYSRIIVVNFWQSRSWPVWHTVFLATAVFCRCTSSATLCDRQDESPRVGTGDTTFVDSANLELHLTINELAGNRILRLWSLIQLHKFTAFLRIGVPDNLVLPCIALTWPFEYHCAAWQACRYLRRIDAIPHLLWPVVVVASIVLAIASQDDELSFGEVKRLIAHLRHGNCAWRTQVAFFEGDKFPVKSHHLDKVALATSSPGEINIAARYAGLIKFYLGFWVGH